MRRGGRGVSLHFVQFHYTTGDPGRSVRSRNPDEWEYVFLLILYAVPLKEIILSTRN